MSAHGIDSARLSKGIQFVNEDNTRSMVLSLGKEVSDSCCSHADKHLYEIRTADGEKRNVRFSSDRPGEQCFSCSWHSHQKNPFWDFSAETLKFPRSFKELYNLLQFLFRLVNSSHIHKGNLFLFLRIDFSPALSKGHHTCLRSDSRKEDPPKDKEE